MTISPDWDKEAHLAVAGLVVARGAVVLAGPLDFALRPGQTLAVTGPNGAGKSTLLRTLLGLLPARAGRIELSGLLASDGEPARAIREAAHYLGHRNAMKTGESVAANLIFWQRFLGRPGLSVGDALAAVGLGAAGPLPFGLLSAGQQRRVALARLLVARRPVWLLDEPTAALDRDAQALFAALAADHLGTGGMIVAATHLPLGLPARELRLEPANPGDAAPEDSDPWQ